MSWLRSHRYWLARRAVQGGILLLFWLGARGHASILTGNLSSSRVLGTVPLSDPFAVLQILATGQPLAATVLVGALIVVLFYWVVGGRAFCAWVCPVDVLRDLSLWLRRRLRITGQLRVDPSTRFWVLGLALPLSALTGLAAFEWLSPIGMIQRELIQGAGAGLAAIGVIVLLDVFVVRRGWCGALCPLGAFYALVGHRSLARVGFEAERCDHCGDCVPACPEPQVIDFTRMRTRGIVDSGDCLNCARCIEVCPRQAYHFAPRFRRGATNDSNEGDDHATQSAA